MLENHASRSRPPCASADLIEDCVTGGAVLIQLFLDVAVAQRARLQISRRLILILHPREIKTAGRRNRPAAAAVGGLQRSS